MSASASEPIYIQHTEKSPTVFGVGFWFARQGAAVQADAYGRHAGHALYTQAELRFAYKLIESYGRETANSLLRTLHDLKMAGMGRYIHEYEIDIRGEKPAIATSAALTASRGGADAAANAAVTTAIADDEPEGEFFTPPVNSAPPAAKAQEAIARIGGMPDSVRARLKELNALDAEEQRSRRRPRGGGSSETYIATPTLKTGLFG